MSTKKAEKVFYVYLHKHPQTKEVVYVGCGCAGRAWQCYWRSDIKSYRKGALGNRTLDHHEWIGKQLSLGYTPADYVEIVAQGLSKEDATNKEKELIQFYKESGATSLFNRCYGRVQESVITLAKYQQILRIRAEGKSYLDIAKHSGLTTMTVWRALNGKTKCYSEGRYATA